MIFGTDQDGGDYVDLVGGPNEPRATVGKIVRDGMVEDYDQDLTRRSQPVRPEEAREVALRLARLHLSQRREVMAARCADVGRERFQVEANLPPYQSAGTLRYALNASRKPSGKGDATKEA